MGGGLASGARNVYQPPSAEQGTVCGVTVPEQIRTSLTRSRTWGKPFPLAYEQALENVRWPNHTEHRRGWQQLLRTEAHIALWRSAYNHQPLPIDMDLLHRAVDPIHSDRQDSSVNTKRCTGPCGQIKPLTDFGKNAARPDGLMAKCKPCMNAANRAYRAAQPERTRAWSREWAAAHRDQNLASQKRWREANREYKRAYDRRRNKDPKIRARQAERDRAYAAANRDKIRANARRQRERNRERIRESARRRYRAKHPPKPPLSLRQRFEERIERRSNNGACWKWIGAVVQGYGRILDNGKSRVAHRVSYELYVGPIPPRHDVCHIDGCDRACVNPAHLFVLHTSDRRSRDRQRARSQM